jgi:hypothetical protein
MATAKPTIPAEARTALTGMLGGIVKENKNDDK